MGNRWDEGAAVARNCVGCDRNRPCKVWRCGRREIRQKWHTWQLRMWRDGLYTHTCRICPRSLTPQGCPGYTGHPNSKCQKMDFIIFSFTQNLLPLWVLRNFTVVPVTCIRNLGSTFKFLTPLTLPLQTHTKACWLPRVPLSSFPSSCPTLIFHLFLAWSKPLVSWNGVLLPPYLLFIPVTMNYLLLWKEKLFFCLHVFTSTATSVQNQAIFLT